MRPIAAVLAAKGKQKGKRGRSVIGCHVRETRRRSDGRAPIASARAISMAPCPMLGERFFGNGVVHLRYAPGREARVRASSQWAKKG
jgi:hypothetical protein